MNRPTGKSPLLAAGYGPQAGTVVIDPYGMLRDQLAPFDLERLAAFTIRGRMPDGTPHYRMHNKMMTALFTDSEGRLMRGGDTLTLEQVPHTAVWYRRMWLSSVCMLVGSATNISQAADHRLSFIRWTRLTPAEELSNAVATLLMLHPRDRLVVVSSFQP